jgi:hypothetical protein
VPQEYACSPPGRNDPLTGALLGSAPRKEGRRARVAGSCVAFHGLRAAPCLRFKPPPTRRRPRPRAPAAHPTRLALAAGGARAPAAPQGAPRSHNPRPARRNPSVAAGWACAVKAKPCAALRVAPAPALTAPTPLLARLLPPGRKSGLGLPAGRPGGAPAGRDASPARLAGGAGPRWFPSAPAPAERRAALAACRGLSGPLARAASGAAGRRRGQGGRRVDAHVPSLD